MAFGAMEYLDFKFLLFKIGVTGWVAVVLAALLYYLVINPLIKELGIFRNDEKGKIGIFGFVWSKITRGKYGRWGGILLTEKEANSLQTADRLNRGDKQPLAYLVFDYYYFDKFEDVRDITDLYEEKYTPERLYAIKMLVAQAKEMIKTGVSREEI